MTQRPYLVAILILSAILAGCADTSKELDPVDDAFDGKPGESKSIGPAEEDRGDSDEGEGVANYTHPEDNETQSEARYDPGWPSLDEATIRPGGYVGDLLHEQGSRCTHNFVFTSPDNRSLYVGTAAHCVGNVEGPEDMVRIDVPCDERESLPIGAEVLVEGASRPGTLAYSSWGTMVDVGETDHNTCMGNDFALVEIHDEDRESVHPAMRHFGGPLRVVNNSEADRGDKVFIYGHSPIWMGQEWIHGREAQVNGHVREGWGTTADGYAISGDSGSPVIDGAGGAFGVLNYVRLPEEIGVTSLERVLAYMHEHTDLEVELAGWEILEDSVPGGPG